jgi:hypothetical protein
MSLVVQLLPRAYYGPYAETLFERLLALPATHHIGTLKHSAPHYSAAKLG